MPLHLVSMVSSLVVGLGLISVIGLAFPMELGAEPAPKEGGAAETDAVSAGHLMTQAVGMRLAGKYQLALEAYLGALRLIKTVPENEIEVARIQEAIAELYIRLNRVDQAAPFLAASHSTFERLLPTLHIEFIRSLTLLGRGQTLSGQLAEAEKTLLRAHSFAEQSVGQDHPDTGVVRAYLGMLYEVKGEFTLAESFLKKAHAALRGGDLNAMVTDCDVGVAWARTRIAQGDYLVATTGMSKIYEKCIKRYGSKHLRTAEIYQVGGELLLQIGQRELARESFWAALQIRSDALGLFNSETSASIRGMLKTYDISGRDQITAALKLVDMVTEAYVKTKRDNSIEYASLLAEKGYFQTMQGDVHSAGNTFKAAVQLVRMPAFARHPLSADVLTLAALFHAWRANWRTAVELQQASERIRELNVGLMLTTGSVRQRYAYMAGLRHPTDITISLANSVETERTRAVESALATVLQRKARILDVLRESANASEEHGRLTELKQERARIRARLAALSISGELFDAQQQHSKEFDKLWIALDNVEANLSEMDDKERQTIQPVTVREIQSLIPADALLVEFVRYRHVPFSAYGNPQAQRGMERYGVFLLGRQVNAQFVDLGEADKIDQQARTFLLALRDSENQNVYKLSQILYRTVMRPVLNATRKVDALIISGDGILDLVPLGVLVDDKGQYLIESYVVSYVTSGRDLRLLGRKAPAKGTPLIVANPDYGPQQPIASDMPQPEYRGQRSRDMGMSRFKPLPGTEDEGRELESVIRNATVLHGMAAREGAIKATHSPVLLHLATHGFSLPEPKQVDPGEVTIERSVRGSAAIAVPWVENGLLRSGLAFSGANLLSDGENDGILTALEASGLDLTGTKVVVLSACDTGVGEQIRGEGVMGFRRAMIMAGAETLVVSLWKVSDSETAALMKSYYCNLGAGLGRAEALRQAQLKFLKDAETSHPFFWGAFLSVGDWQPMALAVDESNCH